MFRNGTMPTFVLIGFLCLVCIILYNYWMLLKRNDTLKNSLISDQEKIDELEGKNNAIEKQNNINKSIYLMSINEDIIQNIDFYLIHFLQDELLDLFWQMLFYQLQQLLTFYPIGLLFVSMSST